MNLPFTRVARKSPNSTVLSDLDSSVGLNTARYISQIESATSVTSPADPKASHLTPSSSVSDVEVNITVKISELKELGTRCAQLEAKVEALEMEKMVVEKELKEFVTKNQVGLHQKRLSVECRMPVWQS